MRSGWPIKIHPNFHPDAQDDSRLVKKILKEESIEAEPNRFQKEMKFVLNTIHTRIDELHVDAQFDYFKVTLFIYTFLIVIIGVVLLVIALKYKDIYRSPKMLWYIIGVGAFLLAPCLVWFYCLYCPNQKERDRRAVIREKGRERRSPSLFNKMVKDAKEDSKPPPKKVKITALLRKRDYVVNAHSMGEFCKAIENLTDMPVPQMLIKHLVNRHWEYLEIDHSKRLFEDYGFRDGKIFHMYNNGCFETKVMSNYLQAKKGLGTKIDIEALAKPQFDNNGMLIEPVPLLEEGSQKSSVSKKKQPKYIQHQQELSQKELSVV